MRFYGQHGEDEKISELLQLFDAQPSGKFDYIDVGANQPVAISNTFRMYREGYRGILVEPNEELWPLLRSVRPEDVMLGIGCGSHAGVAGFHVPSVSVLGCLQPASNSKKIVPVLSVDQICSGLDIKCLTLLAIDVEGMNTEVLVGSKSILENTKIVVVEFDSPEELSNMRLMLTEAGLSRTQVIGCNLLAWRQ